MGFESFWRPKEESKRQIQEGLVDFEEEKLEGQPKKGLDQKEYTHEAIPDGLIETIDLHKKRGVSLEEVHAWYSAAISRRGREPLEIDRFINHFESSSFDPTYAFGEKEKGFLLGYVKFGVFVPTHFAPKTMRGGYELMKQLGESTDIPAVMSVTEDLEETLSKMPCWNSLDLNFLSSFRDQLAEKKIVYNSHPDTMHLMLGLVSEYLEEAKERDVA